MKHFLFDRETQEVGRIMMERSKYRDIAFQYQSALEKIMLVLPDQEAKISDLWLAIGEIRKIAQHYLTVPDGEPE